MSINRIDSPPVYDKPLKDSGLLSDSWSSWFVSTVQTLNDIVTAINTLQTQVAQLQGS